MIISLSVLLRMRNVSDNTCRENQSKHLIFNNFLPEVVLFMSYCGKIRENQTKDDNIIRRMRISCWIAKATDTHSEYVIPTGFPRQQWLCDGASILLLYLYGIFC